jgi:hypothetical protein
MKLSVAKYDGANIQTTETEHHTHNMAAPIVLVEESLRRAAHTKQCLKSLSSDDACEVDTDTEPVVVI